MPELISAYVIIVIACLCCCFMLWLHNGEKELGERVHRYYLTNQDRRLESGDNFPSVIQRISQSSPYSHLQLASPSNALRKRSDSMTEEPSLAREASISIEKRRRSSNSAHQRLDLNQSPAMLGLQAVEEEEVSSSQSSRLLPSPKNVQSADASTNDMAEVELATFSRQEKSLPREHENLEFEDEKCQSALKPSRNSGNRLPSLVERLRDSLKGKKEKLKISIPVEINETLELVCLREFDNKESQRLLDSYEKNRAAGSLAQDEIDIIPPLQPVYEQEENELDSLECIKNSSKVSSPISLGGSVKDTVSLLNVREEIREKLNTVNEEVMTFNEKEKVTKDLPSWKGMLEITKESDASEASLDVGIRHEEQESGFFGCEGTEVIQSQLRAEGNHDDWVSTQEIQKILALTYEELDCNTLKYDKSIDKRAPALTYDGRECEIIKQKESDRVGFEETNLPLIFKGIDISGVEYQGADPRDVSEEYERLPVKYEEYEGNLMKNDGKKNDKIREISRSKAKERRIGTKETSKKDSVYKPKKEGKISRKHQSGKKLKRDKQYDQTINSSVKFVQIGDALFKMSSRNGRETLIRVLTDDEVETSAKPQNTCVTSVSSNESMDDQSTKELEELADEFIRQITSLQSDTISEHDRCEAQKVLPLVELDMDYSADLSFKSISSSSGLVLVKKECSLTAALGQSEPQTFQDTEHALTYELGVPSLIHEPEHAFFEGNMEVPAITYQPKSASAPACTLDTILLPVEVPKAPLALTLENYSGSQSNLQEIGKLPLRLETGSDVLGYRTLTPLESESQPEDSAKSNFKSSNLDGPRQLVLEVRAGQVPNSTIDDDKVKTISSI